MSLVGGDGGGGGGGGGMVGLPPAGCSSRRLHDFLQEQQTIVSGFRAQPWPMQMKLAAVRYTTHTRRTDKRHTAPFVMQYVTCQTLNV